MGHHLNRRQAWKFLFLTFLSASLSEVNGWSSISHRHQKLSTGSFLASPIHKTSRRPRKGTLPLLVSASVVPVDYKEGDNQTIKNENPSAGDEISPETVDDSPKKRGYDLGIGKNMPVGGPQVLGTDVDEKLHWYAPEPIKKPKMKMEKSLQQSASSSIQEKRFRRTRKMVARREEDQILRGALWHEDHFDHNKKEGEQVDASSNNNLQASVVVKEDSFSQTDDENGPKRPALFYPDIDLSIPESVYSNSTDVVWDLMRWEAYQEAQREPLLVSFLYSSILNHDSLESSLAFLLANKISSPAMISTQIQSLVKEALALDPSVGRAIRADIMAVRDRDPACTCLPDVFLYFKGFQALQTYRVANILWTKKGKTVLAHYLQSQMSQTFQIDIHPNATLGSGIMLDHGTGIVIGETARVGHNCSILHHVTLGGSGKKGVDRHPKIGEGVLLGAGASVIGNVNIGDGCQIGAGTLVISDLPAHSVAVGVPAKIIGSFVDVTEQPSNVMNQMMDTGFTANPFQSEGI